MNLFEPEQKNGVSKDKETKSTKEQRVVMLFMLAYYGFLLVSGLGFSGYEIISSASRISPHEVMLWALGFRQNYWLRIGYIILYLFTVSQIWLVAGLFEIFSVLFAQNVKHSLRILSFCSDFESDYFISDEELFFVKGHNNNLKQNSIPTASLFENNLKLFEDLTNLVIKYNDMFRYAILIFQCFTLSTVYTFVYSALNLNDFSGGTLYFSVALSQTIRLLIVLLSFSLVYYESGAFKESWIRALDSLNQSQREKLNFVRPIGFVVGRLYVAIPSTVLTFFSVMTSHVIVLLQVYSSRK